MDPDITLWITRLTSYPHRYKIFLQSYIIQNWFKIGLITPCIKGFFTYENHSREDTTLNTNRCPGVMYRFNRGEFWNWVPVWLRWIIPHQPGLALVLHYSWDLFGTGQSQQSTPMDHHWAAQKKKKKPHNQVTVVQWLIFCLKPSRKRARTNVMLICSDVCTCNHPHHTSCLDSTYQ